MKARVLRSLLPLALVFTMMSCTTDADDSANTSAQLSQPYNYDATELQMAKLINEYRVSIGLNSLEIINYVSIKSEEHNAYMITNNVVNHDYFPQRSQSIMHVLGAQKVNENVAYNYATPEGALRAWLNSPTHKANIEGDFTSFGISVSEEPSSGRKYYTNIFVRQ